MPLHQNKELRFLGTCFLVGLCGAALVYIGDHFRWPNFSSRSGYFGTDYMSSFLYAVNDPFAIHIVAFVWFSYAAGAAYGMGWIIRAALRVDGLDSKGEKAFRASLSEDKRSLKAEQGSAGQPATRHEPDSEGGDKPQPESEGRSR